MTSAEPVTVDGVAYIPLDQTVEKLEAYAARFKKSRAGARIIRQIAHELKQGTL